MKKILTLLTLLCLTSVLQAQKIVYTNTAQNIAVGATFQSFDFTLTRTGSVSYYTVVNTVGDSSSAEAFTLQTNGVNIITYREANKDNGGDWVSGGAAVQKFTNLPPGSLTTSLVRSAGAGLTTKTASTLIILENEDGETDLRILAQLNAFVTNLQGQINSLSNSLAATQGQVTTNTANITSLSNQLATLQGQYTTLSNQLANIPTGLATQSQVNDLQAQLNAQNTKFSNRTSGLLGGNLWNDVISFGGMGMGIFNTGNTFLNNGRSPFGGGNGATVPDAEARPGYYDR